MRTAAASRAARAKEEAAAEAFRKATVKRRDVPTEVELLPVRATGSATTVPREMQGGVESRVADRRAVRVVVAGRGGGMPHGWAVATEEGEEVVEVTALDVKKILIVTVRMDYSRREVVWRRAGEEQVRTRDRSGR